MNMKKPILIGIAGGSASGKSSISKYLKETFNDQSVIILRTDDYYKDQNHLTMDDRIKTNYDHPLAFDNDLIINDLNKLLNYNSINKPIYDFTIHTRSDKVETINSADVIIIEGLFVLENIEILKLLDIKIFVDTPGDIRFIRRLKRDLTERGRTLDSVIEQYVNVVRVMHDTFVEPSKRNADLIVPEGVNNKVALEIICSRIEKHLKVV